MLCIMTSSAWLDLPTPQSSKFRDENNGGDILKSVHKQSCQRGAYVHILLHMTCM